MAGLITQHPGQDDERWSTVEGGYKPANYNVFLDVLVDELIELHTTGTPLLVGYILSK